jgi:hypothetical protein
LEEEKEKSLLGLISKFKLKLKLQAAGYYLNKNALIKNFIETQK